MSTKTGIELIAEERSAQLSELGWTLEHDDEHADGALRVVAAACAVDGTDAEVIDPLERTWGIVDKHGYKGTDPKKIHLLAIAGALIAAEIDRIQRADAR